ncbi:hypothetical protein DFH07DRAFT_766611 [Mycena maculata]|uniref:Uncharacterized protein n=1 Tax=Mycena maculata TaxID=230809 RepID=A0AAD7K567_9AGAR|nr:hypothetical protein DFH07DRAFT_766611 [Mycena maculata]
MLRIQRRDLKGPWGGGEGCEMRGESNQPFDGIIEAHHPFPHQDPEFIPLVRRKKLRAWGKIFLRDSLMGPLHCQQSPTLMIMPIGIGIGVAPSPLPLRDLQKCFFRIHDLGCLAAIPIRYARGHQTPPDMPDQFCFADVLAVSIAPITSHSSLLSDDALWSEEPNNNGTGDSACVPRLENVGDARLNSRICAGPSYAFHISLGDPWKDADTAAIMSTSSKPIRTVGDSSWAKSLGRTQGKARCGCWMCGIPNAERFILRNVPIGKERTGEWPRRESGEVRLALSKRVERSPGQVNERRAAEAGVGDRVNKGGSPRLRGRKGWRKMLDGSFLQHDGCSVYREFPPARRLQCLYIFVPGRRGVSYSSTATELVPICSWQISGAEFRGEVT